MTTSIDTGPTPFARNLMFLGPYQEGGDFRDRGIAGPERFLNRVWDSATAAARAALEGTAPEPAPQIEKALHRTIKKVTGDLDDLSYNTAIAALMDYVERNPSGGPNAKPGRDSSARWSCSHRWHRTSPRNCWERTGGGAEPLRPTRAGPRTTLPCSRRTRSIYRFR